MDINERINNVASWPNKEKIQSDVMSELENFIGTKKELEQLEKQLDKKWKTLFQEKKNEYYKLRSKEFEIIKKEVEAEYGLENKPKKVLEKAWAIAWEYGHSAGYHEVVSYFTGISSLVELYPEKK